MKRKHILICLLLCLAATLWLPGVSHAAESGSYITTEDNENNAGTGKADGDLDSYISNLSPIHPIEASVVIPAGKLPTRDCYIAVRTFDVDWQGTLNAEYDELYVNDVRVGTLTGLSEDWNTSYYRVPVSCLKEGNNTVKVVIRNCTGGINSDSPNVNDSPLWCVTIDWVQLVCDGGSREGVSTFSIKLTDASVSNDEVLIQAQTTIAGSGSPFATEYSVTNERGFIVGAHQGSGVSGNESFVLSMPKDSGSGVYTVQALLKNDNGMILATDSTSFEYTTGEAPVFEPKLTHTLSPATLTNGSVSVTASLADVNGCTDFRFTNSTTQTVSANQTVSFPYTFTSRGGEARRKTYTVKVDNIDKTPPTMTYTPISVMQDSDVAQAKSLFKSVVSATDDNKQTVTLADPLITTATLKTAGEKSVSITATDSVGNQTTQSFPLTVIPRPLALNAPTAKRSGTTMNFTLAATLQYCGGKTITETGFVWGTMQSPTLSINNGTATTVAVVKTDGGRLTATASGIIEGASYYVRAYAKAEGAVYYSPQAAFGIDAPQYGTFGISFTNNSPSDSDAYSYSTFTISRTGGSDGVQTVYLRTVNGSAVGGTHFAHSYKSIQLGDGVISSGVIINEYGAKKAYDDIPATAYANEDRTYQVEIYRVDGGATIDDSKKAATRTLDTSKTASYVYENTETVLTAGDDNSYVGDRSDTANGDLYFVNNRGYNADNGYKNWSFHTDKFGVSEDTIAYLNALGIKYNVRFNMSSSEVTYKGEKTAGYAHIWVGTHAPSNAAATTPTRCTGSYARYYSIDLADTACGNALYTAVFNSAGTTNTQRYFPDNGMTDSYYKYADGRLAVDTNYLVVEPDEDIYCYFGACGADYDIWQMTAFSYKRYVMDTQEPQLLSIAPMASDANNVYRQGDSFTVSLVFDEIVDGTNSAAKGLSASSAIKTSWGRCTYAGGAGTNVLYFTGTVPPSATNTLSLTELSCASSIMDMCNYVGTTTPATPSTGAGSTEVVVDTAKPALSITDKGIANGTASATITAAPCDVLQYAWTNSSARPQSGWFPITSGSTVTTRQTSGKWYLHALAIYNANGAQTYNLAEYDFGTPESPASPLPALSVSVENSGWAKSRPISVTKTPFTATVSVIAPDSSTANNVGNSYTATQNGLYTFTLTTGGETVTQTASVSGIDLVAPALVLRSAGKESTAVYNALYFGADVSDTLSGLNKVEYAFINSASAPASGWSPATADASGGYSFVYTATESAQTVKYLHVRATDNVGNVSQAVSAGYTVISAAKAAEQKPTVTLSGAPAAWTKDAATLTWNVSGAPGYTVFPGGGETFTAASGTISAAKNGLFTVTVVDQNGQSTAATLAVNTIDALAPVLASFTVPDGWAQSKTVTFTPTDARSAQYDTSGSITGYSGSGVDAVEWKKEGGTYADLLEVRSFTADANGVYTLRLTDKAGNSAEHAITVAQIDTTAPTMTLGAIDEGWSSAAQSISVTYADEASGVKTAQYAITTTNIGAKPAALTTLPASGGSVSVSDNGTHYIYYTLTDNAGNVTEGYSAAIKVDAQAPILSVSDGMTGAASLSLSVTSAFGSSQGEVTVQKDGGAAQPVDETTYPVSAKGSYLFTATSGAGKTESVTVNVHSITFDSQSGSEVAGQLVVSGGKATQPAAAPTRAGYTFGGWYKEGACTNAWNFATDTVTADKTIYAKWTINTSTLTVDPNRGTWDGATAPQSFTQSYNTTKSIPIPTRTGHIFAGWTRTNSYGTMSTLTDDATYTFGAKNGVTDTLTAAWTEKATVTIDTNPVSILYDGDEHAFTVKPTAPGLTGLADFTVQYKLDSQEDADFTETVPRVVGEYDVRVTRAEDATYKSFSQVIDKGLTITKATISSVAVTGVVAPAAGATPDADAACATTGIGGTGSVRWSPDDATFLYNKAYTASVTLTADANHKFA